MRLRYPLLRNGRRRPPPADVFFPPAVLPPGAGPVTLGVRRAGATCCRGWAVARGETEAAGSVTAWIDGLKAGDPVAARQLWERYFRRMIRFSRDRLWGADRRATDEEDVALSAFDSFCRGAGAGRFPQLDGRDRLWPLLVRIMGRKAADLVVHERRLKRGGAAARAGADALDAVPAPAPPPDLAAELAEEFCRLLDRLPDPSLRAVAVLKFEGYEGAEIARHLGCGVRTVERKLVVIRRLWSAEGA
jgi:DNA-directed RNA polymerase specialized sigma24 family protein